MNPQIPSNWNALRETRRGDACVIVGNGPSLKNVPLDKLRRHDTFGSNRIYLLDGFTPRYYACVNPLVIVQSMKEIEKIDAVAKFISDGWAQEFTGAYPLHSRSLASFSKTPWDGVYEGYTVTFVLMQIAYFMGYETVYLVGVDHRFEVNGRPNEEVVSAGADPNHFHPDYFGKDVKWNLPDLENSERSYRMARTVFEAAGRKIINLTENSALDVFPNEGMEALS